jgi:hypothetical protein
MSEVLRDIFIAAGDVDRYYEAAPVNLWRARRTKPAGTVFGLIEEDTVLSNGQIRPADITVEMQDGVKWVRCRPSPRGLSTFDAANVFKGNSWEYYRIPKGTRLPVGLAIVKDRFNPRLNATHYTIAPAHDMPLDQFKRLLDQLAILLIREAA